MSQSDRSVDELVKMLKRGELRLPELQRGYVWRAPQVVSLLDSVYRKYPTGSILTWKTSQQVHERALAFDQQTKDAQPSELLLDGQQRLTSLRAVLNDEQILVKGRKRPIRILFNLNHPDQAVDPDADDLPDFEEDEASGDESDVDDPADDLDQETFAVSSRKLEARDKWIQLTDVFNGVSTRKLISRTGVKTDDDATYDKYEARIERLRQIRNYSYRVDTIEEDKSYGEVADIFVRVNSGGTRLRGHDLALAHITATWPGSLEIFEEFESHCSEKGYNFGFNVLLKTMLYFAISQSRFRHVTQASLHQLRDGWQRAEDGLEYAMNALNSNLGIDSAELLSSHFLAIAFAVFGDAHGFAPAPDEMKKFEEWTLIANAKGRYSRGATETTLEQDLGAIQRGGSAHDLLENLRAQVGNLEVTSNELVNLSARSPQFKTMFAAFRAHGANDWRDRLVISLTHSGGRHRIERHHFFPQDALRGAGREKRDIDHGANLAFISARTNKWIAKRPPSVYVPELIKESSEQEVLNELRKQCIPAEPHYWRVENYDEFLLKRRELIAQRLSDYLQRK